ncbi:AraC-like DNA-binding protein [Paenibacillus endophyticus]|uniref:AraC-like DNA-binding protein n=1 Tax=Paenibacillus endophyticus TaxID=1294268 RepID=A0A7W5GD56_9BACL|nr:AraC family transcriptional regulator [Paenibacillus endophyticus]MBB3154692.1 AraC-like DNA-binding protein [Paenibacillus endophyticus]
MRFLRTDIRQPLAFISAGHLHSRRSWTHSRRVIDSFEIIIGVKGTQYIQQQNDRFEVGPGNALLILPGETHFGYQPSEGELTFYWVHFLCPGNAIICKEEEWLEDRIQRESEGQHAVKNEYAYLPLFFRCGHPDKIDILFHQLQHLANSKLIHHSALHYRMTSLFLELAEQADSGHATGALIPPDPLVAEIVEWIRIHTAEPLTASIIADKYGYNRDYLSRQFKRFLGRNLHEYILAQKLFKAKSLLAGTNRTVKQIAHDVGIPDEKYFIRLFRKHEHLTPTGYRNAYYLKHMNVE